MTKLITATGAAKWTKKKRQHNKELVDQYRLIRTMLNATKEALMEQSSKQTCIVLKIVSILSPTNNFAFQQGNVCMHTRAHESSDVMYLFSQRRTL